jgi:hypothetical protein
VLKELEVNIYQMLSPLLLVVTQKQWVVFFIIILSLS